MSNGLAIATVSAALRQKILVSVGTAVTGNFHVDFGRPPSTPPNTRTVNLYLYRVTPNAALRNADTPTRDSNGRLSNRPRAAIDLHYLLSFYGDSKTLESERMLAAVVRDLHAAPIIDPRSIADAVAADHVLAGSDLGAAIEPIRITPELMSLDELSRLWSLMVQSPHAVSVAYAAVPVVLDGLESGPTALPVLKRGQDDHGVDTVIGPFPQLDSVWIGIPASRDRVPLLPRLRAAQSGALLLIDGQNLGGDTLTLGFRHPLLAPVDVVIPPAARSGTRVEITLPAAPMAGWAAGLYSVVATIARETATLQSPVWPMVLAPLVTGVAIAVGPGTGRTVTVTCSPEVLPGQVVSLRAGRSEVRAEAIGAPTATPSFVFDPVPVLARELVWLRVDGAESQPFLFDPFAKSFSYDPAQRLTLP